MRAISVVQWLALALALTVPDAPRASPDPRQHFSAEHSPPWLSAIGRLLVPGIRYESGYRRHHTERCSATLVSAPGAARAEHVVTAWHCLEYYEDLSQRILFSLTDAQGQTLEIEARRLEQGGSMDADWAILSLNRAISRQQAPALSPLPGPIDATRTLVMAGFSRDAGRGMGGRVLSYDPACAITHRDREDMGSDCRAHKGASGGAVVQLGNAGEPWFSGVISRGDGGAISEFVPVRRFRQALLRHLGRPASSF